jgi:triacylglycerol esterase/lipase EstA (alpha/beta hydrolase family)
MDALGMTLRDPVFGIDRERFEIDADFDYGDCANTVFCGADCTIQSIGRRLGQYIKELNPDGDIILVGYSLGGLVARDLMLNNYYNVFDTRRVAALITLGTPNVGYPYSPIIDDAFRCPTLIQQMASDYRSRQSDNLVVESQYLYALNNAWGSTSFSGQPRSWLAAAGTFCTDTTRTLDWSQGCSDSNPASDGVVCDQSARFLLNVLGNKPTTTWADANYAHTESGTSWAVLCGNWGGRYHTLFNPPASGSLVRAIKEIINGL